MSGCLILNVPYEICRNEEKIIATVKQWLFRGCRYIHYLSFDFSEN